MSENDITDLHLVAAEDVELVEAKANEGSEEMELQVWLPLAAHIQQGTIQGFDVVLFHVVVHDPATKTEGAFVLACTREEAMEWGRNLTSVASAVKPIKKQIQQRTTEINQEEN